MAVRPAPGETWIHDAHGEVRVTRHWGPRSCKVTVLATKRRTVLFDENLHRVTKTKTYKKPGDYDVDDPMYVVGCIDAYGAITARVVASGDDVMHRKEESKGRRWRWNIWAQEFNATRNPTLDHLTTEEYEIVNNWLIEQGHKRPEDV